MSYRTYISVKQYALKSEKEQIWKEAISKLDNYIELDEEEPWFKKWDWVRDQFRFDIQEQRKFYSSKNCRIILEKVW